MNEQYTKDYEKLREVIIGANPEIVELKFGCEFNENGISIGEGQYLYDKDDIDTACDNGDGIEFVKGRPIRLADVYLAMWEAVKTNPHIKDEHLDKFIWNVGPGGVAWNLRNDSLDWHYHNKPETVEFLIKLLVK